MSCKFQISLGNEVANIGHYSAKKLVSRYAYAFATLVYPLSILAAGCIYKILTLLSPHLLRIEELNTINTSTINKKSLLSTAVAALSIFSIIIILIANIQKAAMLPSPQLQLADDFRRDLLRVLWDIIARRNNRIERVLEPSNVEIMGVRGVNMDNQDQGALAFWAKPKTVLAVVPRHQAH